MTSASYLERKFIEELNSEGEINIRGLIFSRDKILKELELEGYKILFNEWKEERKQYLLEKANEILELFDNRERFEKLKSIYKRESIIPFIGAGLSIPSGFPSWKGFLELVQKEIPVKKEEFSILLKKYQYEEAAQLLEDNDPNYLQEQLENHFGKNISFDQIDGVICRLPEYFPDATVVTTNYDKIIKIVYETLNKHFSEYFLGLDASSFQKNLREREHILLKLHGTFEPKNRRVLTSSDYKRHYDENNNIKNCIQALFSQSVLFLGCSLNTDRTITELTNIVKNNSSSIPKHYAFLSCQELSDDERKQKRKILNQANIYPIWYDGDHDECIEALLEKLAE
ncbi:SIR2 family protein [Gallibacterium anatis]|uniref:SIR2 family protein n=1 Tax=Gallibacterium anatis TaxID=750 RepID=UPI00254F7594|nr:SIR2 family protein [Gallibacterium anatis]WIM84661.1 SIR2 family protein [Gallibacterium anatis]